MIRRFTVMRLPEPGNWDIAADNKSAFEIRTSAGGIVRVTDHRPDSSQTETGATSHWCELDALVHCVRLLAGL